jgi:hypothetical protein
MITYAANSVMEISKSLAPIPSVNFHDFLDIMNEKGHIEE